MGESGKVLAERVGDRIHVRTPKRPYGHPAFESDLARCKSVSGASWAKSHRAWTYPLLLETCRDLRSAFGSELEVGPELWAWAAEQVRREQATAELAPALDAKLVNLPRVAPDLYAAMQGRSYQLPAVAFGALVGAYINGDQPGLGKTLDALATILERQPTGGNHLILAPLTSLRTVWVREIRRWLGNVDGGFSVTVVHGDAKRVRSSFAEFEAINTAFDRPRHRFLITNIEMMRTRAMEEYVCSCGETERHDAAYDDETNHEIKTIKWDEHRYDEMFTRVWDSVTVDESQKALIKTRGKGSQVRRGAELLRVRPVEDGGLRQALTGTPFKGRIYNLWGTLNWLQPKQYTSFWAWCDSFLYIDDNGFGKTIGNEVRPERVEAFDRALGSVMIRRTKDELHKINPAWAPPPRMYETVHCELVGKQETAYRAMERSAAVALASGDLSANGVLAEMTRLKQFAHAYGDVERIERASGEVEMVFRPSLPSGKFDRMVEMLMERGISGDADEVAAGGKVVIGSQFTAMINLYARELRARGIDCHVLTGETKLRDREAIQDDWQDNPAGPRVLLINTMAGGVSITLDAADEMFVLDETWVPDDQEQLEGRIHRTSRTDHSVTIYYFITDGTIEEAINELCESKDAAQRARLDGRRGVEFAKQWKGGKR